MLYRFEDFVLDTDMRELKRGDDVVSVTPQVFDILHYLIENRTRVVSKDDLIDAIWRGRSISDAALSTRLNAVRNAIGDSGDQQRLVRTLPRKGFRFVGAIVEPSLPVDGLRGDADAAESTSMAALQEKPAIAVLPFQNLSDDPSQEYFADGVVDELITGLSRSRSLLVISRTSTFTYKGQAVDISRVGRELNVRYVLEGSVRKSGARIRVTGQLIDVATKSSIWSGRFDGDTEDIFELQDRLASGVIGAISPRLERAEMERARRKPTESLLAYDCYLRSKFCIYQWTSESSAEALRLSRRAISLDPKFAVAYASAANVFGQRKAFGWVEHAANELDESRRLVEQAIRLGPDDPVVLAHAAHVYSYLLEQPEIGADLAERAVAFDPNLGLARLWAGWAHVYLGAVAAAIDHFRAAVRLSPVDPHLFLPETGLAYACFFAGRYEEGAASARRAIQLQPNFPGAHKPLIANLAMAGRIPQAQAARRDAQGRGIDLRVSSFRQLPFRRREDVEKLEQACRLAGMPD